MFGATPAAAGRGHAVLPAQPVRRRQGLRLLGHPQLPRGLRPVRGQRHPLQPRVAPPRRDLRHPQDHPRGRPHPGRPAGQALPGQPRRRPRLGLRPRVRRGHVADAAARRARRTTCWPPTPPTRCKRLRADGVRARRPRLGEVRRARRALRAPHRGRRADRRLLQGQATSSAGSRRCARPSWSRSWSTPTSSCSTTSAPVAWSGSTRDPTERPSRRLPPAWPTRVRLASRTSALAWRHERQRGLASEEPDADQAL